MTKLKYLLFLVFIFNTFNNVIAQEVNQCIVINQSVAINESIIKSHYEKWYKFGEECSDIKELIIYHKESQKSNKSLKDNEYKNSIYNLTNIYAVMTAAKVIKNHYIENPTKSEKYFYRLLNKIDISSELFKDAFINNPYDLEDFLYTYFLSIGENRIYAMGEEAKCNENNNYKVKYYRYKMAEEVMTKCHQELIDKYVPSALNARFDPSNRHLLALRPIIEKYLSDSAEKRYVIERMDECSNLAYGLPAPDFNLINRKGKIYSLKDFAGKFLVIDMWATW